MGSLRGYARLRSRSGSLKPVLLRHPWLRCDPEPPLRDPPPLHVESRLHLTLKPRESRPLAGLEMTLD